MAVVVSDSGNVKYGTGVFTVVVANGGSGYAVNDVLTLTGGDANATCTVLTVDGSGVVLTLRRTVVGSGYTAGTEATTVAPAGGINCTITITVQAGLSTVNGLYRAEAYNLGGWIYNSYTGLTAAKYITTTFANAGNCQGIILCLWDTYRNPTNDRSVQVDLQENVIVTLTIANPGVVNMVGHGLAEDTPVIFATTGALPTGLTAGTTYYVMSPLPNSFNVSATPADGAINFTGTQSGTQSYWVTRTTVTQTATNICGSSPNHSRSWLVPFDFATPYAVTIAPATWRFSVIQTGGTVGTWYMEYSDAGFLYPFYITWCDTQISFTNNDCLVVKDKVIIDGSATVRGILGTSVTNYATAGVICRSTSLTKANIALLEWENPPASSYTFTVNGQIMYGTGSGFRVGSSTSKILYAQQAIIDFITPTVGTNTWSGFAQCQLGNQSSGQRSAFGLFLYGASPTTKTATLSADALTGQPIIVTTVATGWAINDVIAIGKEDNITSTNGIQFTIQNIVGDTITLTTNLGAKRISGAPVFTFTGYGIRCYSSTSSTSAGYMLLTYTISLYLEVEGVYFQNVLITQWMSNTDISGWLEDAAYRDNQIITKCVFNGVGSASNQHMLLSPPLLNTLEISYVNAQRYGLVALVGVTAGTPLGRVTIDHCIHIGFFSGSNRLIQTSGNESLTLTNSIFTNFGSATIGFSVIDPIVYGNYFYGANGGYGSVFFIAKIINTGVGYLRNNTYERCTNIYFFFSGGLSQYIREYDSTYINNTTGIQVDGYSWADFHIHNNTGAIATNLFTTTQTWPYTFGGTKVRFTDYGGTPNTDFVYQTYGNIYRTGNALGDTTVHTAGTTKFAMRFQPNTSTNNLDFQFTVPTGNIQTKTMTVAVWVKINNATFYGGTHEKPRLTVNYDNGTTTYAEALGNTSWQLISVTFSPATTYGEITVTLSCRTDATGTNAYVYWDDFATLFPGGYSLDTQGMDLWAKAYPVTPPLATVLSAKDVWTASALENYGANTIGNLVEALPTSLAVVDGIVDSILVDTGTDIPASITTIDGIVDAIKLKTDNLPTDPADESLLEAAIATRAAPGAQMDLVNAPNATAVAAISDAIHDEVFEGAITLRQLERLLLAVMAGKASGGGTVTVAFRNQADNKDRVILTVATDTGDRTDTVLDLT